MCWSRSHLISSQCWCCGWRWCCGCCRWCWCYCCCCCCCWRRRRSRRRQFGSLTLISSLTVRFSLSISSFNTDIISFIAFTQILRQTCFGCHWINTNKQTQTWTQTQTQTQKQTAQNTHGWWDRSKEFLLSQYRFISSIYHNILLLSFKSVKLSIIRLNKRILGMYINQSSNLALSRRKNLNSLYKLAEFGHFQMFDTIENDLFFLLMTLVKNLSYSLTNLFGST